MREIKFCDGVTDYILKIGASEKIEDIRDHLINILIIRDFDFEYNGRKLLETDLSSAQEVNIIYNRCIYKGCNSKVDKIIGKCSYCKISYCSRHRILESHGCINLDGCKKDHFLKNAKDLMKAKYNKKL